MAKFLDQIKVKRSGIKRSPFRQIYYTILKIRWSYFFGLVAFFYVGLNLIFAVLFSIGNDSIANVSPNSFFDNFVFSVQTFATIGYGYFLPKSHYAHMIVAAESLVSLVYTAIVTGLTFAKFSRPTIHVVFSKKAIITDYDGIPTLIFRMGNGRDSNIVDANVSVLILKSQETKEGHKMQRFVDLKLERSKTPFFLLTWSVMHKIDESSPLLPFTQARAIPKDLDLFVTLVGYDEIYAQTVHANHRYLGSEIIFAKRFKDIISVLPDKTRQLNFKDFHEVEV